MASDIVEHSAEVAALIGGQRPSRTSRAWWPRARASRWARPRESSRATRGPRWPGICYRLARRLRASPPCSGSPNPLRSRDLGTTLTAIGAMVGLRVAPRLLRVSATRRDLLPLCTCGRDLPGVLSAEISANVEGQLNGVARLSPTLSQIFPAQLHRPGVARHVALAHASG